GVKQVVGRIALARFTNPEGLEKAGQSAYTGTANSGTAQIGAAGDPGFGSLAGGALEMSNVDLSQEFTNLIVAQRGFQANARIITTSDQVLQELVDLKR
ncbi:MAG TPA: flagellar hook-basal body complex protein, partial [Intrasporangium sp.]|nr:flagellar hook-basal body complex protein [Intrasporangium sp.]